MGAKEERHEPSLLTKTTEESFYWHRCYLAATCREREPSSTLPNQLENGHLRYPMRPVLGYGGFRRIHAHSCRSAWYSLILLGLRFGSLVEI